MRACMLMAIRFLHSEIPLGSKHVRAL